MAAASGTAAEFVTLGVILVAFAAAVGWFWLRLPNVEGRRTWGRAGWGVVGFLAVMIVQVLLVLHACVFEPSAFNIALVNYGYAIEIGLLVGGTEMISRYRDDPFAPLVSTPGVFYILINGGAAALAYYLMTPLHVTLPEPLKTLTAGIGAMAFFRSGVFTARIGNTDIPVGPNLVLQVVLQALDRAYDRQRAVPRSEAVLEIMRGVAFAQVQEALPTLCFDLMQNVSATETTNIRTQVAALAASAMSNEAKILSLGLALINVVGEQTLRAAVKTLGDDAQGFRTVATATRLQLAAIDPKLAVATLPRVCAELPSDRKLAQPAPDFAVTDPNLDDDSRAILQLYKLVAYYGEARVTVAIGILASQQPVPPSPPPPPPAVPPPPPQAAAPATAAKTSRRAKRKT